MLFKDAYKKLIKSEVFKKWEKKHNNDFLAHGFFLEENGKSSWQIGYYNKKDDKITPFIVSDKEIVQTEASEIFKRPDATIEELHVDSIKISSDEALQKARELQKKKYKNDQTMKEIMIAQNLDKEPVFNITLITSTFNALNIRIHAITGKIILEKLTPLTSFASE